jgi:preprotein translocase subunit YajC
MNNLNVILMGPPAEGGSGGGMFNLVFIGAMILVFYFFMIRPQTKKAKDMKQFRESLQKGDKIVTIGGIHGKIAEIKDKTVIIETEGGNKLKIERSAISLEYSKGAEDTSLTQGQK